MCQKHIKYTVLLIKSTFVATLALYGFKLHRVIAGNGAVSKKSVNIKVFHDKYFTVLNNSNFEFTHQILTEYPQFFHICCISQPLIGHSDTTWSYKK